MMKTLILFCATIGVAFGWALHDNFSSQKFNVNDGVWGPLGMYPEVEEFNDPPEVVNGIFTTPLDHFNPNDGRRLRMIFKSNVVYFENNGPIFININHLEGLRWITSGLAHDLAQELGGALVTADLRFMGRNSLPNVTAEHFRFYTVDHMVADVAHLVTQVRANLDSPESRVVVFGGRAGATIAALARKRFPQFEFRDPNDSFFNSVSWNIFNRGSEACAQTLSRALQNITQLVEARNRTRLAQLFSLCDDNDFSHPHDAATFYETVFMWIAGYIDRLHLRGIQDICRDINRGPDPLTAFARWAEYVYDNNDVCRNLTYARRLQEIQRFLFVQVGACSISGATLYTTSENVTGSVFPNVISEALHESRCRDVMGDAFNRTLLRQTIEDFHVQHGGSSQLISNTFFTIGDLDPFIDWNILEYDVVTSDATRISLHSAQADMTSISEYDTADLLTAKNRIIDALRRFLRPVENPEPETDE